jgi:hypothetical protein
MVRANPYLPAGNAGEMSPRMAARTDFQKYPQGSAQLVNMLPLAQGGVARRPGTLFVREVKDSTKKTRIIGFQRSTVQAYMNEFGEGYIRFCKDQATIVVDETDAAISNGDFTSDITGWTDESTGGAGNQISHDATNGRLTLETSGTAADDIGWAEQEVAVGAAYEDVQHVLRFRVVGLASDRVELRIGTTTNDDDIVADKLFEVGYHCYAFTPGASSVFIQFRNRGSFRDKDVQIDDVSLISAAPVEIGSPYTEAQLFSLKRTQSVDVMYLMAGGTTPVYKLKSLGHESWSLVEALFEDGPWNDENDTATTLTVSAATGMGITITASAVTGINGNLGWQASDIGRSVRIKVASNAWGWAVIRSITTTLIAVADVRATFTATTASTVWRLGAWSATTGYPRCATFHQQRLFAGGTTDEPAKLWSSETGFPEAMSPDSFVSGAVQVEDDDALDYRIVSKEVNAILWMTGGKALAVGTTGREWTARSDGPVLTPTDIALDPQTSHGSADVDPVEADNAILFLQRAQRKIREFVFSFEDDGYKAPDMNVLADHIMKGGIADMAYQQEPDSLIWCVRRDGQMPTFTYKREQDVLGWGRQILGGFFAGGHAVVESVAVIAGNDAAGSIERDEVWMIVKRTIDGATQRYIEVLAGSYERGDALENAVYVDSALTLDNWNAIEDDTLTLTATTWKVGEPATLTATGHAPFQADDAGKLWRLRRLGKTVVVRGTALVDGDTLTVEQPGAIPTELRGIATAEWLDPDARVSSITNLDHLEGETIGLLTDGAVHPRKVVSGGAVTLDAPAGAVVAGLPYTHKRETLRIEGGAVAGTSVGKKKRIHGVTLVLLDSMNAMIGPSSDRLASVPFRAVLDSMDQAVPLFSGDKFREIGGDWTTDARLVFEGSDPTPFTVLALAPEMKTNDMK